MQTACSDLDKEMITMSNNWIIVGQPGEAATLAEMFECPREEVSALAIGPRSIAEEAARAAGKVEWIECAEGALADAFAPVAAERLLAAGVDVALGTATPAARSLLGIVGERLGAGVVSNVTSVKPGDTKTVEHLAIDDRVVETMETAAPVVLLANPLSVKPDARLECPAPATIEQIEVQPADYVRLISLEPAEVSGLESAERVVGVGRGVKDNAVFDDVARLADALGAEVGCTMPIYTDYDYLPKDSHYIGLSGVRISPKLYLAFGISGTSQHLAGIRNAETVVCVNKDPQAKFFSNADYGIVGTVEEIVPALARAIG